MHSHRANIMCMHNLSSVFSALERNVFGVACKLQLLLSQSQTWVIKLHNKYKTQRFLAKIERTLLVF